MADELQPIIDETGQERRLGSLLIPDGFVCAFPVYEDEQTVWDDAQIRKVITDPNRTPRRATFGKKWIQNQGSHGSCNGYALAGALAKSRYLRGIQDGLILSGAYPYSKMNGGRDNGSALEDGLKVGQEFGCPPESLVPWSMIYPRMQPANANSEAAKHKAKVCYRAKTLQGLRTGLAQEFTAIVAVHAGGSFQKLNSKGIAGVSSGSGNHAVHVDDLCIVGGTMVYDMANSWGLGYGTEGRAYLTNDTFAGTFRNHAFYLIGSTEEAAA